MPTHDLSASPPRANGRELWLVAYDVRCPRRLRETLQAVRGFSTGGQKSVHECWLSAMERRLLRARLAAVIDPREDSVLLVRLDPHAKARAWGRGVAAEDPSFFYVG